MRKSAKISVENFKGLEKFISNSANPKFFFTMTEINKIGINPRSGYNTPLGVYAYPLTQEYYQKLVTNTLPFAGSKPYVNLFTLNVPTFNMTTYSEVNLKKDTEALKVIYNFKTEIQPGSSGVFPGGFTQTIIDQAFQTSKQNNPISKFWNLTRILSQDARNWNYLLRKLGYSNFYDPGTGLIYDTEPVQIVILDPTTIITVESYYNPHVKLEGEDLPHVPPSEKKMLEQRKKQFSDLLWFVQNTNNTETLNRILHKYIKDPRVTKSIMRNGNITAEMIRFMYPTIKEQDDTSHMFLLVSHRETPADILDQISGHLNNYQADLFEPLLNNPNLSMETRKKISKDDRSYVRLWVARSHRTPPEILEELSRDPDPDVQVAAIHNDNITSDILRQIFDRMPYRLKSERVLQGIASNSKTPADILDKMAHDPNSNEDILEYIASNLEALPATLEFLIEWPFTGVKLEVAKNRNTTPETLDKLANSSNSLVRERVANNSHTSIETLTRLSQDENYNVQIVAKNGLNRLKHQSVWQSHKNQPWKSKEETVADHAVVNMTKHAKKEKLPLSAVRKLPYKSLNRMIKKMREYLKKDEVVQKMFKEYKVDIEEIDYIPMMFGNIDVSAKTDHGILIFNYKLLTDGDFFEDFSYGVHEMTHWLQQTTGEKATQSSDDGSYLDNPYEQEGFQNQVQYIAEQFGDQKAEKYVDDLLEHHEVDNKKEIEEKKETLMSKV